MFNSWGRIRERYVRGKICSASAVTSWVEDGAIINYRVIELRVRDRKHYGRTRKGVVKGLCLITKEGFMCLVKVIKREFKNPNFHLRRIIFEYFFRIIIRYFL